MLYQWFMLIDDLSKMSESLNELEREQESVNKEVGRINELRKALLSAEEKLVSQTAVTHKLEIKLLEAHQGIYKRYTQIQQLETSCREHGTCLHGSEYEIPAFGFELMWNKIRQVSDKRDNVIAKREMIRTRMKNPDITKEEMSSVLTRRIDTVDHDSGADKYSLLHNPNKSHFSPLPVELIIGHNMELKSPQPCKFQCEESVLKNVPLEGAANQFGHSQSSEPIFENSNNPVTSSFSSENVEFQPLNSVSSKTTQHASSEVPENCSSSQSSSTAHLITNEPSSTEAIKTQESQVLGLASRSEATTITHISESFKSLVMGLVGAPASNKVLSVSVSDKRNISEVGGSLSGPNSKRINPSVSNRQISDINVTPSESSSKLDNDIAKCEPKVSVSKPIKSHLKYKSVLQYKKKISRIPTTKADGEIVCRYEVFGKCQDKQCKYKHFSPRS